ncbi:MAG TPA: helix-turn-helix domain-containing protein [Marmoricola sp.]|jgi:DNA-binding HxlR family transcriptional regulator|nr:helix-turn-helix domain-containing protein [Marmoricola sp.]
MITTDRDGEPLLPRPVAVQDTVAIVSDPWSFALLMEAYFGVHRFEDFQHNLAISRNVLTKRLGRLVEEEILQRDLYQRRPDRYEYHLTPKGRALYPIFLAIQRWGEEWLPGAVPTAWHMVHTTCGSRTAPRMACDVCERPVTVSEIRLIPNDADHA